MSATVICNFEGRVRNLLPEERAERDAQAGRAMAIKADPAYAPSLRPWPRARKAPFWDGRTLEWRKA